MKSFAKVAVASRSFCKHPVLRRELLERYESVTFNDAGASLRGDSLAAFLAGHEKAILALEPVDEALLARLPDLKAISKFGVGLDGLDLDALDRRGVLLAWTGGTNSRSVAELALMMIIALLRRVPALNAELKAGGFRQEKGGTLTGRTVGLVGGGAVGRDLARLLAPFGARVVCHDPAADHAALNALDIETVELDELLSISDAVSLHAPLTPATRGLIGAARLALMKPTAVLINTARGGLVDETALKDALKGGRLAGAGLDVFEIEPPKDPELLALPTVLATPHIGGSTEEAILAMGRAAIAGLDAARPARAFKK